MSGSQYPANTRIITPHVTLQEVSDGNMPAGQDCVPQYVSTPVLAVPVSKTTPELVKSQKVITEAESGSHILPHGSQASVIQSDPGHSKVLVPTSSQPTVTEHLVSKSPSTPDRSSRVDSPHSSRSIDTQTISPPTHLSI